MIKNEKDEIYKPICEIAIILLIIIFICGALFGHFASKNDEKKNRNY